MNVRVSLVKTTCGHSIRPNGVATGYARWVDGSVTCYPCTDDRIRADAAETGRLSGYVSTDNRFTTWSGGFLGTVTEHRTGNYRYTPTGGEYRLTYVTVRHAGADWSGAYNANSGNAVALQRRKGK